MHLRCILQIPAKEGWISGHIQGAFEMWQPCLVIMMHAVFKCWLQRIQPLNWDAAHNASHVHTTGYCIKMSLFVNNKDQNKHGCCCIYDKEGAGEFIFRNSFFLHERVHVFDMKAKLPAGKFCLFWWYKTNNIPLCYGTNVQEVTVHFVVHCYYKNINEN